MIVADAHQTVNEWIKKYSDIFYNYILNRVPDSMTAKDIVQETFVAAWKSMGQFKQQADEKTWLFAILKNKLMDYYRIQARSLTHHTDTGNFFDNEDHWTEVTSPLPWTNAVLPMEEQEFYRVLEHCQSKLSRLQQITFIMKYIDEQKSDFICKVLNITPSNYWVIIHRCKLQLRECLEKNWFLK